MKVMNGILKGELIGLTTEVADARNESCIGIKGKIIDDTKNTITIQSNKEKKMIQKDQVVLRIEKGNSRFLVDGALLKARPEDRIKVRGKW